MKGKMLSKTVVVFTCAHSSPEVSNKRFDWLGEFLYDLRPDMVMCLGDFADMKSLNTYDTRYPQQIVTQNYERDIDQANEAQDRIRRKFRLMKRKRPFFVGFEGNHENRIKKALANDPRIEGGRYGVSFSHLNTDMWV
jgi:predicted phosphodiesterase